MNGVRSDYVECPELALDGSAENLQEVEPRFCRQRGAPELFHGSAGRGVIAGAVAWQQRRGHTHVPGAELVAGAEQELQVDLDPGLLQQLDRVVEELQHHRGVGAAQEVGTDQQGDGIRRQQIRGQLQQEGAVPGVVGLRDPRQIFGQLREFRG